MGCVPLIRRRREGFEEGGEDRSSAAAPHLPSGLAAVPLDVGSPAPGAVMAFTRAAGAPLHPVKRFLTRALSLDSDQIALKQSLGAPESSQVQPATNSIVCSPFPLAQAEEGEHLGSPVPENDP